MTPSLACDERVTVVHDGREMPMEVWTPGGGPAPAVLVISEIFGLNDDMRQIASRFAAEGYLAAAPDLYRGGHWARCAWRAMAGLQFTPDGGTATHELEAALQLLEARDDVRGVGAVGFCMGGGFALMLGTMGTARVAGGFYGAAPSIDRMRTHMCPVLGGFGAKDRVFAREGRRLERDLTDLGIPHDIRVYDNVGHSYMTKQEPGFTTSVGRALMAVGYNAAAAEDSWERMLGFFAEHLGPPSPGASKGQR